MASNQLTVNEFGWNENDILTTNFNCISCGTLSSINIQNFLENCTMKECEEIIKMSNEAKCVKVEKFNNIKLQFEKEADINIDILKEFIKLSGDVNLKDNYGNGFLHRASKHGNIQMINFLIKQDASSKDNGILIDIKNKNNNTPLHLATINGHAGVVKILLSQNADVSIKNDDNKTPLLYINHGDVLQEFINAKPNLIDESYKSILLFKSIKNNREELFDKLVDEKLNLNIKSNDKVLDSPVIFAARYGRANMLQKLIQNGADMLYKNTSNNTAIHSAAYNGHDDNVKILLKNGVNIEEKANNDNTPLLLAAWNGRSTTIEILLDRGANILSVNKDLWNALHLSSYNNHISSVELLLGRGAMINELNHNKQTPLKLATNQGHTKLAQILINKGAKIN